MIHPPDFSGDNMTTIASGQVGFYTVSCNTDPANDSVMNVFVDQVHADDVEDLTQILEEGEVNRVDPDAEADGLDPDRVFVVEDVATDTVLVRNAGGVADGITLSVALHEEGADGDPVRDRDRMLELLSAVVPAVNESLGADG